MIARSAAQNWGRLLIALSLSLAISSGCSDQTQLPKVTKPLTQEDVARIKAEAAQSEGNVETEAAAADDPIATPTATAEEIQMLNPKAKGNLDAIKKQGQEQ